MPHCHRIGWKSGYMGFGEPSRSIRIFIIIVPGKFITLLHCKESLLTILDFLKFFVILNWLWPTGDNSTNKLAEVFDESKYISFVLNVCAVHVMYVL